MMTNTLMPSDTLRTHVPNAGSRIVKVFEGWAASRQGRAVPRRSDFDPLQIPDLLKYAWIYRYHDDIADYVCELAGEDVNAAWGCSIKGRRLKFIVGEINYPTVRERWDRVQGAPLVMFGAAASESSGGGGRFVERLIMPLTGANGRVDSIIGVSFYDNSFDRRKYKPTVAPFVAFIPVDEIPQ